MKTHMFGMIGADHQVIGGIVQFIPINMMAFLAIHKRPILRTFRDNDVLEDISLAVGAPVGRDKDLLVSLLDDKWGLMAECGTGPRTIGGILAASFKRLATMTTDMGVWFFRPTKGASMFDATKTMAVNIRRVLVESLSAHRTRNIREAMPPTFHESHHPLWREFLASLPLAITDMIAKMPGLMKAIRKNANGLPAISAFFNGKHALIMPRTLSGVNHIYHFEYQAA